MSIFVLAGSCPDSYHQTPGEPSAFIRHPATKTAGAPCINAPEGKPRHWRGSACPLIVAARPGCRRNLTHRGDVFRLGPPHAR